MPPRDPGPGASIISARPVTAAMGMPPPKDFAIVIRSGSMPKCSEANHLPVRAKAGLDFVRNEEDAVLAADILQKLEIVAGRNDEATFAVDRLDDQGSDGFRRDGAFERVFEMMRKVGGRRARMRCDTDMRRGCDRCRWQTAGNPPCKDASCS